MTLSAVADASRARSATAISLEGATATVGCSAVALGSVRVRGMDRTKILSWTVQVGVYTYTVDHRNCL